MRMSCNGCRILRKGCSDECVIRPCLEWIASADSQANATIFLAKFYGRAGLFNLITAASQHLRPAIFKSLLYEACGRMVNPVFGSVGLLCSGDWERCQAAVDAVLTGTMNLETNAPASNANVLCCDIRHVCTDTNLAVTGERRKVSARSRFKKPDHRAKPNSGPAENFGSGSSWAESEANRRIEIMNRGKPNRALNDGSRSEKGDNIELELTLN